VSGRGVVPSAVATALLDALTDDARTFNEIVIGLRFGTLTPKDVERLASNRILATTEKMRDALRQIDPVVTP
jgi:hypothetical protein